MLGHQKDIKNSHRSFKVDFGFNLYIKKSK